MVIESEIEPAAGGDGLTSSVGVTDDTGKDTLQGVFRALRQEGANMRSLWSLPWRVGLCGRGYEDVWGLPMFACACARSRDYVRVSACA
eukprot:3681145-Pleurochrysis_carterae.AAC.3